MLPADLRLAVRGWLSSNTILVGHGDETAVVDTGHVNHAAQVLALVRGALGDAAPARLVNTHLHSDHCGGNAALAAAYPGVPVAVPQPSFEAVRAWDEAALSYRDTGQRCERFLATEALRAGTAIVLGRRRFETLAAPGHDPHALLLFDARDGILISGDALWEQGFGVVFAELEAVPAFDAVEATLAAIERLAPAIVLPGHGAAFTDVDGALQRARARLQAFRAEPARHARYGAKVLVKYHLMEVGREPLPALQAWVAASPLAVDVHRRWGHGRLDEWLEGLVAELVAAGSLGRDGNCLVDLG